MRTLSRRELQVIQHLATEPTKGAAIRVAHELGITHNTVRNYLRRAYAKTGLRSQAEVIFAIQTPNEREEQTLP